MFPGGRLEATPEETINPDLGLVIEHWDRLPTIVRAGIVAMVQAASIVPSSGD